MTSSDIVIAHAENDAQLVTLLSEGLKELGCSVWCSGRHKGSHKGSRGPDLGQQLVTCKVFMPLFNDDASHNNSLRDTLALAYVSNKAIVPIATRYFRSVNKHLNSGLKLILARINWIFFVKEDQYEVNLQKLQNVIKEYLITTQSSDENVQASGNTSSVPENPVHQRKRLNVTTQTSFMGDHSENDLDGDLGGDLDGDLDGDLQVEVTNPSQKDDPLLYVDFWDRHFQYQLEVPYTSFRDQFVSDYGAKIARRFGEDNINLFQNLMYKDVFNISKTVKHSVYKAFICDSLPGNPDVFYDTLQEYAISYFATREVFDMDSTVRLTAIQNLGKFNTEYVADYLIQLTEDQDPNVRAISGLALAKTGRHSRKFEDCIMGLMGDEDRLVRESACLSLAYMRCTRAAPGIVNLWRNDPIKQVREAAEIALERMGGDEAHRNIKITKVLTQEMQSLKSPR